MMQEGRMENVIDIQRVDLETKEKRKEGGREKEGRPEEGVVSLSSQQLRVTRYEIRDHTYYILVDIHFFFYLYKINMASTLNPNRVSVYPFSISTIFIFMWMAAFLNDISVAFFTNQVNHRDSLRSLTRPTAPYLIMSSYHDETRRSLISTMATGAGGSNFFGGLFGGDSGVNNEGNSNPPTKFKSSGATNEVIKVVNGIKHRRLGGSNIIVSEMGLGTQRWVSTDFNAPNAQDCYEFMDEAILKGGINLIDTAEQYPIPSGKGAQEGDVERVIGTWMKDRKVKRENIVIATKITGGRNVTPKNIKADCDGSLKRLQLDYIDVYQLHWPQRYSPQSNWGQSLMYNIENDSDNYWRMFGGPTSFEDLCLAMQNLIDEGKIRGWGLCNDNAYGLTACTRTAKMLGTTPPCNLQGDFSLIDRKSEENGVAEAASKFNENVGFMAYNALAGGMLTGKYMDVPAAFDDFANRERAMMNLSNPRGRMDERGWGGTLYRYRTEAARSAISDYAKIAKKNGMSLTELSLRWCRQRSLVTTTLLGHSNVNQLKETMKYFQVKEPLSGEIMWDIDMVHMRNRLPIFSNERVGKEWNGLGEIGEPIP
jgi:aryl-alcohol dehydrogenase-like predicted oxidoreductase